MIHEVVVAVPDLMLGGRLLSWDHRACPAPFSELLSSERPDLKGAS